MAVDTGTVQVVMPAMGDSVAEGTVLEWHKQEGDTVAADETHRRDLHRQGRRRGSRARRGHGHQDPRRRGRHGRRWRAAGRDRHQRRRRVGDGAERLPAAGRASPRPVSGESPPTTPGEAVAGAATEAEGVAAAQEAAGQTVDIVTPTGGESVTEGTILEWSVKVGDEVKDGDTVVEISTDKVDMELPAPASGTITEILAQEGETVTVGQVIGRMSAGAEPPRRAGHAPRRDAAPSAGRPPAPPGTPAAARRGNGDGRQRLPGRPPRRRRRGRRPARVQGTARGGRITKADVLAAGNGAATHPGRPAARAGRGRAAQLIKGGGAALARYMDQSRSIPTATSFRTLTVTTLDERRKQLKNAGQRVSFTHLIAYAIARVATDDMPVMAHHFAEIDGKPYRHDDGAVNLGLAVDVEKKDGTPHADGAGDPRRRPPELRRVPRRLQRAGREGAHQHADRR